MALTPGERLGPYEVIASLGAGGMGEVYRARDSRLGRDVAIKVLPARFLGDPDARTRFEREARAVAALSHPHIMAIHDLGEYQGGLYAVTELLEGETLAQRLEAGPIPVRKALDLAGQMADGLAAAHEKGIVHRDLKPANVFLTTDGRVKILDFGLAKIAPALSDRTQTMALGTSTEPGTVLGTVQYMSPEQVRAGVVDHRSDLFSFGAVLYEMLTAKRAFTADSAVETMNAILREEPRDSAAVNPSVPPGVDRILQRCLEKKPEQRFQSARDLAFALGNTGDSSSRTGALPAVRDTRTAIRPRSVFAGAGLLLIGGILGALIENRAHGPADIEPVKVTPLTHSGHDWAPSASPDGKMLAFCSDRDGRARVWLRSMKGGTEVPLTEGPDFIPRFSPDGSSILFVRGAGSLRTAWRTPVVGGQPRAILDNVSEAAWSPDGNRIAFLRPAGAAAQSLTIVGVADVQGGDVRELAKIPGKYLYGLGWSPDGKWLAATTASVSQNAPSNSLLVFDAATGAVKADLVRPAPLSVSTWDRSSGSLVLAQSTSLVGDTSSQVGRVYRVDPFSGRERALFWVQSVYTGGVDVVRFDAMSSSTFVFDDYDWKGSLEEVALTGAAPYSQGRLMTQGTSRDRQPAYARSGDMVIFSSNRSGNLDLWTVNLKTGDVRQVTDDAAEDWDPAFTADGRGILWSSSRGGHLEIWTASADGTSAHQVTQDGMDAENPTQSPDGAFIVYGSGNPGRAGIWRIGSDGTKDTQIAKGNYYIPDLSPDGRYVAYGVSDPTNNRAQVLVSDVQSSQVVFTADVTFVAFHAVVQSGRARWMPDGKSLVFVGVNEHGRGALFQQEFRPGADTTSTRRILVQGGPDSDIESFGISPDGHTITAALIEESRFIKLAEGVPGL